LTKGKHLKKKHKVWTTTTFRRPRTLSQKRNPKALRHSTTKAGTVNKYAVIEYPLVGESASKLMEDQNTLVFIVGFKATKNDIKRTFKQRFDADIRRVNTLIRPDGKKKAFITLKGDQAAVELGSKIGII
jgi:large subunit ribosomal protein L23Ae